MNKYRVYMTCTAVYYTDVEAENAEEAGNQVMGQPSYALERNLSSTNDWSLMEVVELEGSKV